MPLILDYQTKPLQRIKNKLAYEARMNYYNSKVTKAYKILNLSFQGEIEVHFQKSGQTLGIILFRLFTFSSFHYSLVQMRRDNSGPRENPKAHELHV